MMNDIVKSIFDRIKQDKRTTVVAAIAASVWGAGFGLSSVGFEPWGTIVSAIGVVIGGGALLFTMFVPPPPPAMP